MFLAHQWDLGRYVLRLDYTQVDSNESYLNNAIEYTERST